MTPHCIKRTPSNAKTEDAAMKEYVKMGWKVIGGKAYCPKCAQGKVGNNG